MVGRVVDGELLHLLCHFVGVPTTLDEARTGHATLGADGCIPETQRDFLALVEPVAAAHQQGIKGIGGRGGVLPTIGLLLGEQPNAQLVEHVVVLVDFGKGRHDVGVGGDVRLEAEIFLRPIHADLLILLGAFLEALDHQLGGGLVAVAEEYQGTLGTLVEVERGPGVVKALEVVFLGRDEVAVGVLRVEEAQGIQFGQGGGADGPVFTPAVSPHVTVGLCHVVFQITHGFFTDASRHVLVGSAQCAPSAHLLQPAEAGQDVSADIRTLGHAVHPRPAAVVFLLLLNELQGAGLLAAQVVDFKEVGYAAALLGLALGLQHPRRLLQHDGLQVLVFLELREQRIGRFDLPFLDVSQQVRDVVGDVR